MYANLAGVGFNLRNYYFLCKSRKTISNYLLSNDQPKLNIGCYNNPIQGWLNADLFYNKDVVYLDAGKPFSLKSEIFEYIYSEHVFEHLNYQEASNFLAESYRILRKGGIIRIATPDLDFLIDIYRNRTEMNDEYISWSVETYFPDRNQESFTGDGAMKVFVINHFFRAWGHQLIHNFDSLSSMLRTAGFTEIKKMKPGESEHEIFLNIEKHGTVIPERYNDLETMVVEATR